MKTQFKTIKELEVEQKKYTWRHGYKSNDLELQIKALKDVWGLNKEVIYNLNKHPATDEFSKGFQHACEVIEKELKKRING